MKALVLSGGGSKGAYQVGVLECLMQDFRRDYEIVCGVSVGALNAAAISQAHFGDPRGAYASLSDLWKQVSTPRVRKHWFLWYLASLWKSSVYDSRPLERWVHEKLSAEAIRRSQRKFRVGAVDWYTGEYRVATEDSDDLLDWVLASASFPGFFKPMTIEDREWTDGGVRNVTPLGEAIRAGASEIDVIMTSNPDYPSVWKPKGRSVLWRFLRAVELALDEVMRGDLKEAGLKNDLARLGKGYRLVKIRVLQPSKPLDVDSLSFDPEDVRKMRALGYAEAPSLL